MVPTSVRVRRFTQITALISVRLSLPADVVSDRDARAQQSVPSAVSSRAQSDVRQSGLAYRFETKSNVVSEGACK